MHRILIITFILFLAFWQVESIQPPYRSLEKTSLPTPLSKRELPNFEMIKTSPPLIYKGFIVIDPGHGGHDVGTQSISKPRYQEKSLNLKTANFLKNYLQQLGYHIVMTRQEDKFVSLDKRAQFANEQKPTLFVSIHYNSAPSSEAKGVEVYFYQSQEDKARANQSKRLAQSILKHVTSHTKAASRGIKHGNFAVIRETNMPAVLIEGGFLTNESELKNLKEQTYLKKLALGIAKGIEEYLNKKTLSK
jgi:N-acetylmuramoyl-L-alanine amidase